MSRYWAVLVAVVTFVGGGAAAAAIADAATLPEGAGRQQIIDSCTRCHGVDVIVAQPRSPDEWAQVVSIMVGQGVSLTDEEYATVVSYLSETLARPADGK